MDSPTPHVHPPQQQHQQSEDSTLRFSDLSIDDTLLPLPRLLLYCRSQIALQRLVHVKMLEDVTRLIVSEHSSVSTAAQEDGRSFGYLKVLLEEVAPVLRELGRDEEYVVRQHLSEQLGFIGRVVLEFEIAQVSSASSGSSSSSSGDADLPPPPPPPPPSSSSSQTTTTTTTTTPSYRPLLLELLLPLLHALLSDPSPDVRHSTSLTLILLSPYLTPPDLSTYLLTSILTLCHDDKNEELRMTSCTLLSSLADTFGSELSRQFLCPEMISLAEDECFRVRKCCAVNVWKVLGGVCGGADDYLNFNDCANTTSSKSKNKITSQRYDHLLPPSPSTSLSESSPTSSQTSLTSQPPRTSRPGKLEFTRLLETWKRLATDDMYRVRKACAEGGASVCEVVVGVWVGRDERRKARGVKREERKVGRIGRIRKGGDESVDESSCDSSSSDSEEEEEEDSDSDYDCASNASTSNNESQSQGQQPLSPFSPFTPTTPLDVTAPKSPSTPGIDPSSLSSPKSTSASASTSNSHKKSTPAFSSPSSLSGAISISKKTGKKSSSITSLIKVYLSLLIDNSKFVRQSAYSNLGRFISCLSPYLEGLRVIWEGDFISSGGSRIFGGGGGGGSSGSLSHLIPPSYNIPSSSSSSSSPTRTPTNTTTTAASSFAYSHSRSPPKITIQKPYSIDPALLAKFCSMCVSDVGDDVMNAELRLACAFSFPGVLFCLMGCVPVTAAVAASGASASGASDGDGRGVSQDVSESERVRNEIDVDVVDSDSDVDDDDDDDKPPEIPPPSTDVGEGGGPEEDIFERVYWTSLTPTTTTTTNSHTNNDQQQQQTTFAPTKLPPTTQQTHWTSLYQTYKTLTLSSLPSVRKTLAHSLHVVASTLPVEVVERDLVGVFEGFLRDDNEEVRFGVVCYVTRFLERLTPRTRAFYLPVLTALTLSSSDVDDNDDNDDIETYNNTDTNNNEETSNKTPILNWRMRNAIALQMPSLISLFPLSDCMSDKICGVVFELLGDGVSVVRGSAMWGVRGLVLKCFEDEDTSTSTSTSSGGEGDGDGGSGGREENMKRITTLLLTLSTSQNYSTRLTFLSIVSTLLRGSAGGVIVRGCLVKEGVLKRVVELGEDKICIVRVGVFKVFGEVPGVETMLHFVQNNKNKNITTANSSSSVGDEKSKTKTLNDDDDNVFIEEYKTLHKAIKEGMRSLWKDRKVRVTVTGASASAGMDRSDLDTLGEDEDEDVDGGDNAVDDVNEDGNGNGGLNDSMGLLNVGGDGGGQGGSGSGRGGASNANDNKERQRGKNDGDAEDIVSGSEHEHEHEHERSERREIRDSMDGYDDLNVDSGDVMSLSNSNFNAKARESEFEDSEEGEV